jgi:hypothetical protein
MKTFKITTERPTKGQTLKVYGQTCTITKVWPFGTVDVLTPDGKKAFRVTGLNFL